MTVLAWAFALLVPVVPSGAGDEDGGTLRLALDENGHRVVEFADIPDPWLVEIRQSFADLAWGEIFVVRVADASMATPVAMLGGYEMTARGVRFVPRFPLQAGLAYRAEVNLARLALALGRADAGRKTVIARLEVPEAAAGPPTEVTGIFPSARVVPENLLKFYLVFSAPMSRGEVYRRVTLRGPEGEAVERPFLELAEELWDPGMMRLTLFIDPGRIKRGVTPHEEVGPSLRRHHAYRLVIDANWPDARGRPLAASAEKAFQVGPPDHDPVNPDRWSIATPSAATRMPLVVTFPGPLDYGLLHRVIRVENAAGLVVPGRVTLAAGETEWHFTPDDPWREGVHSLSINRVLEDLAGNSVGRRFEVPVVDGAEDAETAPREWRTEIAFIVEAPT